MRRNLDSRTLLAGSVSLITLAVYLSSLRNDFVYWDDNDYVFENPNIKSFNVALLRWAFLEFHVSNWHPLTWISHALDYAVWGLNPLGHHLTSIMIHAVNTALVIFLVIKLAAAARESAGDNRSSFLSERAALVAGGVTGLLFGLHPLHVESVAWVAERKDLLCALFFLLSTLAYAKYALRAVHERVQGRPFSPFFERHYLISLGLFVLALLSKPMAVTLPLVLLILDWYPFGRVSSPRTFLTAFVEKLPFLVMSLLSSVLTVLAQRSGHSILEWIPLPLRVLVGIRSLVGYIGKMVVPLNLVPFYPYPGDVSLLSPEYLASIVFVLGMTIVCFAIAKKQKVWLAVWSYYVITLIPVLGFVQVGGQSMADRYTYLPALGPFLIIGIVAARVWETAGATKPRNRAFKVVGCVVAALLVATMAYLTARQIRVWKNSIDLWTYVIQREPDKVPRAYNNRGNVFNGIGRPDAALADYEKAITLLPSYYEAYFGRGLVFERLGRLDKALADYERAIAIDPSRHEAYYGRGNVFKAAGQFERALADYDRVIAMNPSSYEAYYGRGLVFEELGRLDKALADYDKAIAIDPSRHEAYYGRGNIFRGIGQFDKALSAYDKAVAVNPSAYEVYINRGLVFEEMGRPDKALADYDRAISVNPSRYEAHNNRGLVLGGMGQSEKALESFHVAIRLNQNQPVVYFNRGNLYLKTGQRELALPDFRKACDLGNNESCNMLHAFPRR